MEAKPTLDLDIRCSGCNGAFIKRIKTDAPWHQRSRPVLCDRPRLLFAWLCGRCVARFSDSGAADDYLDAMLDEIEERHLRSATG